LHGALLWDNLLVSTSNIWLGSFAYQRQTTLAYSPKASILTKKFHNTDPLTFYILFTVISNFAVLQANSSTFPLSDTVLNKAGTPYMTLL